MRRECGDPAVVVLLRSSHNALYLKMVLIARSIVTGPSPDFSRHTLVRPRVYHGRTKRQISSTKENVSTNSRSSHFGQTATDLRKIRRGGPIESVHTYPSRASVIAVVSDSDAECAGYPGADDDAARINAPPCDP